MVATATIMELSEDEYAEEVKRWQILFKESENEMFPLNILTEEFDGFNYTSPQYYYVDYDKFPNHPRQLQAFYSGYELHPIKFQMPDLNAHQFALATELSHCLQVHDSYWTEEKYERSVAAYKELLKKERERKECQERGVSSRKTLRAKLDR